MIERVARIRIELKYTQPKIWRRVEVPLSFTLWEMNAVVQATFDWDGDHLWAFELGKPDRRRLGMMGHFGWGPEEAEDMQIETLVDWGVKKFGYTYDFGDTWEHLLTIMRVLDADPRIKYPNLVAGANSAPIEDIGGIWGYYRFVEAAQDPNDPYHADLLERFREAYVKDFDHEHFDRERADRRLEHLR